MSVKLPTERHLKILRLTGGCTGSSESILVKMQHCWKSHVTAHIGSSIHHVNGIARTLKKVYAYQRETSETRGHSLRFRSVSELGLLLKKRICPQRERIPSFENSPVCTVPCVTRIPNFYMKDSP